MAGFYMLRHLDIFAREPGLFIDGNLKFKSKTGAIFTFVYFLVILSIVFIELRSYVNTSSPVTATDMFRQFVYPRVNLSQNKIIPALVVYTDDSTLLSLSDYSTYFTLAAYQVKWAERETENPDEQSNQDAEKFLNKIDLIPCSELHQKNPDLFDYYYKPNSMHNYSREIGRAHV